VIVTAAWEVVRTAPILGADLPPGAFQGAPTVELRLDSRDEAGWTVLEVVGEVDLSSAPLLRARIEELLHLGSRRLVVDLRGVGFMDSSGLSVLVASMKRMKEAGGELTVACPSESILKVFTVTGLDRLFVIRASVDGAMQP
jgi:anti-sigma B factor antagonist